ncbi:MAG: DUF6624 domain-containing protein [Caulobacterales bacterium]
MILTLRIELVERARAARDLHASLVKSGQWGIGYPAKQEELDIANVEWFSGILDAHGWPGPALVGDDGAAAAVQILQRGTSRPGAQKRGLTLMMDAAQKGQASLIDAAHFADRIAVFEGKPQLFGTQLDWGADGQLAPAPVSEPAQLDARRAAVGLPPLDDLLVHAREATRSGPPADLEARRAAFDGWAKRVGWR